jgi:hypothetical protein
MAEFRTVAAKALFFSTSLSCATHEGNFTDFLPPSPKRISLREHLSGGSD